MFSSWTIVQFLVCAVTVPVNNRILPESNNDVLIPPETWYNAAEKNEGYAGNLHRHEYGGPVFNDVNESGAKSLEVTEGNSFYDNSGAHVLKIKKKKRVSKPRKFRKKVHDNSTFDKVDTKKNVKKIIKKKIMKRKKKMKADTVEVLSPNSTENTGKPVDIIVHITMN